MMHPLFANDAIQVLQLGYTQKAHWLLMSKIGPRNARIFWLRSGCRYYTECTTAVSISKSSDARDSDNVSDDQISETWLAHCTERTHRLTVSAG
jgi:hypothetical protein